MKLNKPLIKKYLLNTKYPYFVFLIIKILAKRNIFLKNELLPSNLLKIIIDNHGFSRFNLTGTGVLIFFYEDHVKKLPLSESSKVALSKDLKFFKSANNLTNYTFLDYQFFKRNSFYVMDIFHNLENNFAESIEKISTKLYESASLTYTRETLTLIDLIHLLPNYQKINHFLDADIYFSLSLNVHMGFMHGDLTINNILRDNSNHFVLIDLDRSNLKGIKEIDDMHFFLDYQSKKLEMKYFEYIKNFLDVLQTRFDINHLYLYLIYRACNEFREKIELDPSYYSSLNDCHNHLLTKLKK